MEVRVGVPSQTEHCNTWGGEGGGRGREVHVKVPTIHYTLFVFQLHVLITAGAYERHAVVCPSGS